jgi:hypothetical protein
MDGAKVLSDIEAHNSYLAAGHAMALSKHRAEFGGRGPHKKNVSLREFIWHLADVFDDAGGKPNASYQDRLSENEWGKRDARFLRFCELLNSYLPSRVQAEPKALAEQVDQVCERWKDYQRKFLHCKLVGP